MSSSFPWLRGNCAVITWEVSESVIPWENAIVFPFYRERDRSTEDPFPRGCSTRVAQLESKAPALPDAWLGTSQRVRKGHFCRRIRSCDWNTELTLPDSTEIGNDSLNYAIYPESHQLGKSDDSGSQISIHLSMVLPVCIPEQRQSVTHSKIWWCPSEPVVSLVSEPLLITSFIFPSSLSLCDMGISKYPRPLSCLPPELFTMCVCSFLPTI